MMATYILEAVLNNEKTINLNFLVSNAPSLLEIDKFTNVYSKWDFIHSLENYLDQRDIQMISSFRISIKGKDYSYSVMFQNPFLESVINGVVDDKHSLRIKNLSDASGVSDMRRFLFQDFENGGKNFLQYYQYRNKFSRLVNKYLCSFSDSEEDMHQKKLLEDSILKELMDYKTYRSLCVYRNHLDRRINSVYHGIKPVTNLKPQTNKFLSSTFQLDKEVSSIYAGYKQIYVDDMDNEKEEFLDSEEIEEMGNYYGK